MLRRPEGDAFVVSYAPSSLPHLVRWVLCNADQQVAALALPSTCEPEGYLAESRKGHVRTVAPRLLGAGDASVSVWGMPALAL